MLLPLWAGGALNSLPALLLAGKGAPSPQNQAGDVELPPPHPLDRAAAGWAGELSTALFLAFITHSVLLRWANKGPL